MRGIEDEREEVKYWEHNARDIIRTEAVSWEMLEIRQQIILDYKKNQKKIPAVKLVWELRVGEDRGLVDWFKQEKMHGVRVSALEDVATERMDIDLEWVYLTAQQNHQDEGRCGLGKTQFRFNNY